MRAAGRLALAAAALPVVVGVACVRPAVAQVAPVPTTAGYASYSLTASAAGVRTGGDVGASGGLVTLDTASASVTARLDSSPSADVRAAPYEPGQLFRTVVGQVNGGAGQAVLDVPDAEAQFPGSQTSDELTTVPPSPGEPVASRGGAATASAGERAAAGSATGEALSVTGVLEVGASTTTVELSGDPGAGSTTATARTSVARVLVAGVLELRDVTATATVTATGDEHVADASLTVGGASVAGQEVALTDEGLVALGTPVLPGQTVRDLTAQADAALTGAGVRLTSLAATRETTPRSATASTGGLRISVGTPELPGGVAPNVLDVTLGQLSLVATDTPAVPPLPPVDPVEPLPPTTTTTTVLPPLPGLPGTPGIPRTPGTPAAPATAAPPAPASLLVAGRELPALVVLAAFAAWQFLSLGTATLYALVDRRRRATLGEVVL